MTKPIKCSAFTSEEAGVDFAKWRKLIPMEFSSKEYKAAKHQCEWSIGASDVGTVMGVNPFSSPLLLYKKLKGEYEEEYSDATLKAFKRGTMNESHIAYLLFEDLKEEYGEDCVKIFLDKHTYMCGEKDGGKYKYPWMIVNFDCYFKIFENGRWKKVLGEIKTLSSRAYSTQKEWKEGIIPMSYEFQCRYMMKALDIDECVICCAWGLSEDERVHLTIKRDPFIESVILDRCEEFIRCLDTETAPEDIQPEKKEKEEPDLLPEDYSPTLRSLYALEEEIANAQKTLDELEQKKNALLAELTPALLSDGTRFFEFDNEDRIFISVKSGKKRGSVDSEKLKEEHPDIYKECVEECFSSTLLKALDKKQKSSFYRDYFVEGGFNGKQTVSVSVYPASLKEEAA